jgi:hypothetical protein
VVDEKSALSNTRSGRSPRARARNGPASRAPERPHLSRSPPQGRHDDEPRLGLRRVLGEPLVHKSRRDLLGDGGDGLPEALGRPKVFPLGLEPREPAALRELCQEGIRVDQHQIVAEPPRDGGGRQWVSEKSSPDTMATTDLPRDGCHAPVSAGSVEPPPGRGTAPAGS